MLLMTILLVVLLIDSLLEVLPMMIPVNQKIRQPEVITHPDGSHSHPDGKRHVHSISPEAQATIQEFIAEKFLGSSMMNVNRFLEVFNTVPGILDLYEHNEQFRTRCIQIGIEIKAGYRAQHYYRHAYVVKYAAAAGSYLTILTSHDFDKYETKLRPWADLDLFRGES